MRTKVNPTKTILFAMLGYFIGFMALALVSGCGHKGPLKLPEQASQLNPPVTSPQ